MIIRVGYSVKVSSYDGNKVLWEVLDYHVVEEGKEHYKIGLQGFTFNLFDKE